MPTDLILWVHVPEDAIRQAPLEAVTSPSNTIMSRPSSSNKRNADVPKTGRDWSAPGPLEAGPGPLDAIARQGGAQVVRGAGQDGPGRGALHRVEDRLPQRQADQAQVLSGAAPHLQEGPRGRRAEASARPLQDGARGGAV
eukprot:7166204-Prymnesium_polylepis.1